MNPEVTNTQRLERLVQLKNVVAAAPDENFNMSRWGRVSQCGTACCALGHAALDPYFQNLGMSMQGAGARFTSLHGFSRMSNYLADGRNIQTDIIYDGVDGLRAGVAMFGITDEEAKWLFLPQRYVDQYDITKGDVVRRINTLIRKYS